MTLHQVESCVSATFFGHMHSMFLKFVVAREEKFRPNDCQCSDNSMPYSLPNEMMICGNEEHFAEQCTISRGKSEFSIYTKLVNRYFKAGITIKSASDVLCWYENNKATILMISNFASSIFAIVPSQIENERDISVAGGIARVKRASMTAENLAMLVFIHKHKALLDPIHSLNIFDDNFGELEDDLNEVENYHEEYSDEYS